MEPNNSVDINEDSPISLGGNIELVGFRTLDGGSMVILKKLIGNHVRRMYNSTQNVEKLTLILKPVGGSANKYEVQGKLLSNGRPYSSEVTDYNVFFTTDKVLSKIQNMIAKE
jgi:hypothetical protein